MSTLEFDVTKGVVIFSSDYCPYCIRAKNLLAQKGVAFEEIRVDGATEVRAKMAEMAGKTSVPQIWISGQHVGGCDDLFSLEDRGELDTMLQP